ncbi:MAG: hypothetical protein DSZ28_08180 [Thiothrix sp.]|nr:MAG: hypothetical protein DSZ28_08180 [Thiothrix sp.]
MCRISWFLAVFFFLTTLTMAYMFIYKGSVESATDGRSAIRLTTPERDLVLTEMRAFLASVQGITQGISEESMELVSASARKVGAAAQQEVPGSLIGKLPLEFKKLGFDTHGQFDALALDAEQLGDGEHALTQLSTLMKSCVACHESFRFTIEGDE